jgi:hypothetical protein
MGSISQKGATSRHSRTVLDPFQTLVGSVPRFASWRAVFDKGMSDETVALGEHS